MNGASHMLLRFLGSRVAPPRFVAFLALFILLLLWLHSDGRPWTHALIISFDGAALFFLAICAPLLRISDARTLRRQAAENDANRATLLAVTGLTTLAILVALMGVLPHASTEGARLIIVLTLAIAWLFSNTVYALHYAHLYYLKPHSEGGLGFAGTTPPDYGDFLYFAFTLGMTFQTSDIEVKTREFRRVVTLHALAAFVFNLGVVAFAINVLGSHG